LILLLFFSLINLKSYFQIRLILFFPVHSLSQVSPAVIGIENYSKYSRKYLRGIFLSLNIFAFVVFTFRWKSRRPDAIDQACSTSHGMEFGIGIGTGIRGFRDWGAPHTLA